MRKIILILCVLCALIGKADSQGQQSTKWWYIQSGGATIGIPWYQMTANILVGTYGATNLGGNSYTLTYASQPAIGSNWDVHFYASQLTAVAANVTIFGRTPLVDYPNQGTYWIHCWVDSSGFNTAYVSSDVQTPSVNYPVNFTAPVTFSTASVKFTSLPQHAQGAQDTTVVLAQDSVAYQVGCAKWGLCGNPNYSRGNYFGTPAGDTVDILGKMNGVQAFLISSNLNNSAFGYGALQGNTTGLQNCAFGSYASYFNTTGYQNTTVGNAAGETTTTGSYNTTVGFDAGPNSATTNYAISLGWMASASSNQFTVANVRSFSFPNMASGYQWVWMDTTAGGTGQGTFQPLPGTISTHLTSVTGDSVLVTTGSYNNFPAGTLANLTYILPANPTNGQVIHFYLSQIITTLKWSVRLEPGNLTTSLPSSATANGAFAIQFDSTYGGWVPHN